MGEHVVAEVALHVAHRDGLIEEATVALVLAGVRAHAPSDGGDGLRASRRRAASSASPLRSSSMYSGISTSPGQACVQGRVATFIEPATE